MAHTGKNARIAKMILEQVTGPGTGAMARSDLLNPQFNELFNDRFNFRFGLPAHMKPSNYRLYLAVRGLFGLSDHIRDAGMCATGDQNPSIASVDT